MALGDGRLDTERLLDVARAQSRRLVAFDMEAAARDAGTVVSAVMFGAIAATGVLPFRARECEAVVRESGVGGRRASPGLRAGSCGDRARCGATAAPRRRTCRRSRRPRSMRQPTSVALGHARAASNSRTTPMQSCTCERVRARARRPSRRRTRSGAQAGALTRETARYLALWMAFDDVVRVAALKCRASRFARVRREVGAGDGDVVRIVDHFKPGVPELAGLLPAALATRLVAWERRRRARGASRWRGRCSCAPMRADGLRAAAHAGGLRPAAAPRRALCARSRR